MNSMCYAKPSAGSSNKKHTFHVNTIFHALNTNHDNIKNEYITRAAFDGRRLPRRLADEICKSKMSNKHCNGLYNYVWLLCNAHTNINPNDAAKQNYTNAYLETSLDSLMNAFEARNKSICFEMLDQLKEMNLIDYEYDKKIKTVTAFVLTRETDRTLSSKKYGFETSAIKKHLGFIQVSLLNVDQAFACAEHYSVRDALVFLWLHAIYDDYQYPASAKAAVVAFNSYPTYFTLKLNNQWLSSYWKCSRAQVYNIIHKLQDAGFLTICTKNGKCLVISVNHYSEWLWKKPSQTFTDDDVEVLILNRDPSPEIRAQQKEVNHLAAVAKNYDEDGILRCDSALCAELIKSIKRLLELQCRYHNESEYLNDIWKLKQKMEYNVKNCPQNERFWVKLNIVFYQAYAGESTIYLAA